LHVGPNIPLGEVASRSGPMLAGDGFFKAVIKGKGGHAANPQHAIDPILAASNVIVSLQHIVSREADPLDTQVKTCNSSLFEEKMLEIIVQHCLFTMIFEYDENLRSECLPNIISSQVVTIGNIQGGGAFNVIPNSVTIGGTFRGFLRESLTQLRHRIEQVCYKEEQIHNDLYIFSHHELRVLFLFVDIRIVRLQITLILF